MIAVDVEATGTNCTVHSILAVGAVEIENPHNRLYVECRAWEGAHIDADALRICGFTRAEALDARKITEAQLIGQFLTWADSIDEQTLVGQNVSFDRSFLEAAAQRAGYAWPFASRTIDTHTLAFMHITKSGFQVPRTGSHSALNLDTILRYVGLPSETKPHNALTGALSHAETAARLLWNRPLLPEFSTYPLHFVLP